VEAECLIAEGGILRIRVEWVIDPGEERIRLFTPFAPPMRSDIVAFSDS
jgi:hypothetical protein